MDDDDFFSAFEELQESTAKAEAIHKALVSDSTNAADIAAPANSFVVGAGPSVSTTSTHSTDSAGSLGGGESDIEIIEPPTSSSFGGKPSMGGNSIAALNLVTNPDGTKTITLPPGTDAKSLLAGLQPPTAATLNPRISVIPDSSRLANAQAAIRSGKQVVSLNAADVAATTPYGAPRGMTMVNGANAQQVVRYRPAGVRSGGPGAVTGARGPIMVPSNVQMANYGELTRCFYR